MLDYIFYFTNLATPTPATPKKKGVKEGAVTT